MCCYDHPLYPKEGNSDASDEIASLLYEFLRTLGLIFIVGCCVLSGSDTWSATAIAAMFIVVTTRLALSQETVRTL